jgi:hypothetical protein
MNNGHLPRSHRLNSTNPFRNMSLYNDDPGDNGWYPDDGAYNDSSHGDTDGTNSTLLAGLPPDALEYLMGENGVEELILRHF